MSTDPDPNRPDERVNGDNANAEYLSLCVGGQWFGIPVLKVQDVLARLRVAPIPLSPPEVAGSINLRGRIVTVVDMRVKLGLGPAPEDVESMSVVVEYRDEAYSVLVDEVGEVLQLRESDYEPTPATLEQPWRDLCIGLYRLDENLLLVLDIERFIGLPEKQAA
jgi:purine-binding chemotaxis protein CheW